MASTMGLNRDGWANGYRYLVASGTGQAPYIQLPITDGTADSGTLASQDYSTLSYATSSITFGNHFNVSSLSAPSSQVKSDTSVGTPSQDYYPAFTEVQNSVYGYNNLEHYGTTNVGKAVAMSLASMENCNTIGQTHDSQVADAGGVCQGIITSSAGMVNDNCNGNGEFLFNEFLGGDNELPMLDVCKQSEATTNFYKMESADLKETDVTRNDTIIGSDFPNMTGDNIYINIDSARKGDISHEHVYTPSQHVSVQKKYKFYGKGRPYDMDEAKFETRDGYETNSASLYLPESHYQRGVSTSVETTLQQQYNYPNEINLVNRTIVYGQNSMVPSREVAASYQFPSGSGYQYPTTFPDETMSSDRSEDSDSRSGSCKSDDRVSKDEKRAKELKIPLSTHEIISLPIDEFNEKLSKFELTDPQLSLIRDIRRRGKNKVAAQNCRKRKLDQIYTLQNEVQSLHMEKVRLESQQEALFKRRLLLNEKYIYMYQLINNFNSKNEPVTEQNIPQFHM